MIKPFGSFILYNKKNQNKFHNCNLIKEHAQWKGRKNSVVILHCTDHCMITIFLFYRTKFRRVCKHPIFSRTARVSIHWIHTYLEAESRQNKRKTDLQFSVLLISLCTKHRCYLNSYRFHETNKTKPSFGHAY